MTHLRVAGHVSAFAASALVALVACRSPGPPSTAAPGPTVGGAVVERIVDGDTVDVDIGGRDERVRLIGIDTPIRG